MIIDIDDATVAQAAVLAIDGVAAMHPGRYGEVALLYPHERVVGLKPLARDGEEGLEAHVVVDVDAGRNVYDVAEAVRHTVRNATGLNMVDVTIGDVISSSQGASGPDNEAKRQL
ncbi:hypothetical protein [Corynebacterium sp.]|uniref:hypothetical protein n=1 Tax=Corynebacterium sp. TaxID=1720 RepID=UPI00373511CA